ncbi:MAG: hypothetical protein AAGA92_06200 [Planctomycetota bacterium]
MPLAAATSSWPKGPDATLVVLYLALVFGLPLLGYVFFVLDFRRYLRSLRRAVVLVSRPIRRRAPYWSLIERPPCLEALGLQLPCTEEEVLAAYRSRVKAMHPDRGGEIDSFLQLQKQFDQAMYLVRSREASPKGRS